MIRVILSLEIEKLELSLGRRSAQKETEDFWVSCLPTASRGFILVRMGYLRLGRLRCGSLFGLVLFLPTTQLERGRRLRLSFSRVE